MLAAIERFISYVKRRYGKSSTAKELRAVMSPVRSSLTRAFSTLTQWRQRLARRC